MVAGGSEMNTSFNILAISGSLRARSSNTEVFRAALDALACAAFHYRSQRRKLAER